MVCMTLPWREMDSNYRYPAKFFGRPSTRKQRDPGFSRGCAGHGGGKHLTDCRAEFGQRQGCALDRLRETSRSSGGRCDRQPRRTRQHCDHSLTEPRRHHYRTRDIAFAIVGR